MDTLLTQLASDPLTNAAIKAVIIVAVLDFITGTIRAVASKTFGWEYIDVWCRKQLVASVMITLVLLFGVVAGDITVGNVSLNVLTASGLVAAATFVAAQVKSILDNLNASVGDTPPTA